MNTKTKIALGILGAAAAGVVVGLLLAPDKGSEMRKKLKKTANGWADNLSSLFVQGKEEVEEIKSKVRGAKADAEEKVSRVKESLNS